MKRLTVEKEERGCFRVREIKEIIARLAKIENILSDENGEYDLDRIKSTYAGYSLLRDEVAELIKAKREGRCFISGVSLGDEVYYIPKFNGNPCGGVRTGHVQAVSFTKAGKRIKIREYHAHNQDFMIGKTVFLTREAAEQALKEYKDGRRD